MLTPHASSSLLVRRVASTRGDAPMGPDRVVTYEVIFQVVAQRYGLRPDAVVMALKSRGFGARRTTDGVAHYALTRMRCAVVQLALRLIPTATQAEIAAVLDKTPSAVSNMSRRSVPGIEELEAAVLVTAREAPAALEPPESPEPPVPARVCNECQDPLPGDRQLVCLRCERRLGGAVSASMVRPGAQKRNGRLLTRG